MKRIVMIGAVAALGAVSLLVGQSRSFEKFTVEGQPIDKRKPELDTDHRCFRGRRMLRITRRRTSRSPRSPAAWTPRGRSRSYPADVFSSRRRRAVSASSTRMVRPCTPSPRTCRRRAGQLPGRCRPSGLAGARTSIGPARVPCPTWTCCTGGRWCARARNASWPNRCASACESARPASTRKLACSPAATSRRSSWRTAQPLGQDDLLLVAAGEQANFLSSWACGRRSARIIRLGQLGVPCPRSTGRAGYQVQVRRG